MKRRGTEFPKKKFNGERKDGGKQRNAKPDDVEKGICFNFSRGNGYCKYGDACKFKHEGPKGGGGGGKRKAALIAPKGIVKKKEKGKKKKAAKSFASMMAKDLKEIMAKESDGSEAGSEEGEKGDGDNDSLIRLIRGGEISKREEEEEG